SWYKIALSYASSAWSGPAAGASPAGARSTPPLVPAITAEVGLAMSIIRQDDFIQSIADALQYISYYHPKDFIDAVHAAYRREQLPAARDALAQILINSRMCAEGRRPICQDTGI